MFLRIAYGLGNLFNDIRGANSACAQDGPSDVTKTDTGVHLMHRLGIGEYTCMPTRYRHLLLHLT